jgi:hypothetical protein
MKLVISSSGHGDDQITEFTAPDAKRMQRAVGWFQA